MMNEITGILHAGLSVRSMEESLRWYEEILGFRLLRDDGFVPPLQSRVCFMERDSFQLELFEYQDPRPLPADRLTPDEDLKTIGTKHICFSVCGMDSLKEKLLEHGVEIAHEVCMGPQHVLFIYDPSRILIELIEG